MSRRFHYNWFFRDTFYWPLRSSFSNVHVIKRNKNHCCCFIFFILLAHGCTSHTRFVTEVKLSQYKHLQQESPPAGSRKRRTARGITCPTAIHSWQGGGGFSPSSPDRGSTRGTLIQSWWRRSQSWWGVPPSSPNGGYGIQSVWGWYLAGVPPCGQRDIPKYKQYLLPYFVRGR